MENKIIVENKKGEQFEADVVMCFDVERLSKSYIVYKFPDESEGDLVTIHTSILVTNADGSYKLEEITDNEEWKIIKNIMKKIVEQPEEV